MITKMQRPITIYFEGTLTGTMHELQNDMWYIWDRWEAVSPEVEVKLVEAVGATTIEQNIINWAGPLIEWSQNSDKRHPSLFLGFANGDANFRLLTDKEAERVKTRRELR